jgi:hypothetical protein
MQLLSRQLDVPSVSCYYYTLTDYNHNKVILYLCPRAGAF